MAELQNEIKENLKRAIDRCNVFTIVTTGRAGTDFLQSCYDSHHQIATTSEKSQGIKDLILKYKENILPYSSYLFSTLAVEHLIYSFAPQLNLQEDWQINKNDNFRKANVEIFINSLKYLLDLKPKNKLNNLYIAKSIILAFSSSLNKDISKINCILLHLHSIGHLNFYSKYFSNKDLLIVCSRSFFNLLNSGVKNWRNYAKKLKNYLFYSNIYNYRKVYNRIANDYIDIKRELLNSKIKVRLTMLEKLGGLQYLNRINKLLKIEPFKRYPKSTVLGIPRRADLVSNTDNNQILGTFNKALVFRGNPSKLIGIVESIIITLTHSNRIKKYECDLQDENIIRFLKLNNISRYFLFHFFLIFPTKIEFLYYGSYFPTLILLIKDLKNKSIFEKFKIYRRFIFLFFSYFQEYILIRLCKRDAFLRDFKNESTLREI